jgi:hypothetical protein
MVVGKAGEFFWAAAPEEKETAVNSPDFDPFPVPVRKLDAGSRGCVDRWHLGFWRSTLPSRLPFPYKNPYKRTSLQNPIKKVSRNSLLRMTLLSREFRTRLELFLAGVAAFEPHIIRLLLAA